jgi:hypothetical protein
MTDQWSDEQPDDPQYADQRDFYKVETWSRDGMRTEQMLYADSNLGKAIFSAKVKHPSRIQLTIGQRTRVLQPAADPLVVAQDAGARRQALLQCRKCVGLFKISGLS